MRERIYNLWQTKIKKNRNTIAIAAVVLVLVFALWGPELIAGYKDRKVLNQITAETVENESEGYRYSMNSNQKLYLLSKCLDNQVLPESELSTMTDVASGGVDYEELTGTYALVVNYQGPSEKEITEEEIFEVCSREMENLHTLGIIPESVREISASAYTAVLYSAIDVLEPRNNIAVWKVSLSTDVQNADKANRMIDAYIDADSGKVYEFYVRTEGTWAQMQPDAMVQAWSNYLGLSSLTACETINPLSETTQNVKKYTVPGTDDGNTTVTLGFYEGINELFLKIEK
jgi:hypothetical protein